MPTRRTVLGAIAGAVAVPFTWLRRDPVAPRPRIGPLHISGGSGDGRWHEITRSAVLGPKGNLIGVRETWTVRGNLKPGDVVICPSWAYDFEPITVTDRDANYPMPSVSRTRIVDA